MALVPKILTGLRQIAGGYDIVICDIWGVVHNGMQANGDAVEALRRYRSAFGPVVLLSNAPRPVTVIEGQLRKFGVAADCYDAVVTSGDAVREDLERRSRSGRLALYHLGPQRDRGVIEELPVECVDAARATLVLCTGLFDDDTETPADYRMLLSDIRARGLTMLCANPDKVVHRGGRLVYCAGALASLYEELGGRVVYYGKPHAPIYRRALAAAERVAGKPATHPLAIGDGLDTDIRGANSVGIDALFIAEGIHEAALKAFSEEALVCLFAKAGVSAQQAMRRLVW